MKKVLKKVQTTKLNEKNYVSLNGEMLSKIKGSGSTEDLSTWTDRLCGGGCGSTRSLTRTPLD
jgi:hypothetical protein